MVAVANAIEQSDAVVITGNRLAVDDAGARAEAGQGLDDQGKTISEIVARAAVEYHLGALLAGNHPKAVVLDLVRPFAA
jgi:hypothetical protein